MISADLQNTYSKMRDLQSPFEAAVIMPTILHPRIFHALDSIYAQSNVGRIQILIGIDQYDHDELNALHQYVERAPENIAITILNPGYSTSARHGGLHRAYDGGALRTILSFLANSAHLTYLDDDNWWEPNHISSLLSVIKENPWAFSHRCYVHHESHAFLARDQIESVGPGKGIYNEKAGGFVDPNCLMINKQKADAVLPFWSVCWDNAPKSTSADRLIFDRLRKSPFGDTNVVTVNYVIDPEDPLHDIRLQSIPKEIRNLHFKE